MMLVAKRCATACEQRERLPVGADADLSHMPIGD
jgi:hypothetical protein